MTAALGRLAGCEDAFQFAEMVAPVAIAIAHALVIGASNVIDHALGKLVGIIGAVGDMILEARRGETREHGALLKLSGDRSIMVPRHCGNVNAGSALWT